MSFGERLKKYRLQNELTQELLAERIGVKKSTIAGYERGNREPDVAKIKSLAHVLGTTADELLGISLQDEKSPGLSTEAMKVAKDYDGLTVPGQRLVRVVIDELKKEEETDNNILELKPAPKILPLLGNSFAAGPGEPDFGNFWEDYEVPYDSPAEFAIRISGDSMEPYLPDGSIQLCRKSLPRDGEVGAFLIDGEFLCKQMCIDATGALHLFSLNRARKDLDRDIPRDEIERQVLCFGTVIMERVPLPLD